ncbi:MAG: hypothetical protein ACR2J9_11750 [Gaiellales bacterium]
MRRLAVALIALAAFAVAPSALAAKPAVQPSYLFAMTSTGGALKHDASGWWVELTGTSPLVTRFTDRPNRLASTLSPTQLAAQWRTYGFPSDPPNAALVLDGRPVDSDVFVVELRRPSVSGTTVRFRAKPVHDSSQALSRYAKRADRLRETRFASASLFIDDGAGTVYQPVTFTVSGLFPGQALSINLQANGTPAGFSAGPSLTNQSSLSLLGVTGEGVPVAALRMSDSAITLNSTWGGGGGGNVAFQFSAFLAADEGIQFFSLSSPDAAGATVTVQLGSSVAQVVNATPTLFSWNSY